MSTIFKIMGRGGCEYEGRFEKLLKSIGLSYSREPSVRSEHPVKNKNGEWKKYVTTPDFAIETNEKPNDQKLLVEVTKGNGCGAHKKAQRRVINAMNLGDHYIVFLGSWIETAESIENPVKRKKYLSRKLKRKI